MSSSPQHEDLANAIEEINQGSSSVSLSSKNINDDDTKLLAEVVAQSSTLVDLSLEWNVIGNEGARSLTQALEQNRSLGSLLLTHNNITETGATYLAQALRTSALHNINLAGNQIKDDGACALANVLIGNTALRTLDLANNGILHKGAVALARALKQNSTLMILNLTNNSIGSEGATALANALETNYSIRKLKIKEDGIPRNVLSRINSLLKRNQAGPIIPPRDDDEARWMKAVQDAVAQGDEHPWACIKLMIVGRGAAGKTSLVRSLLGRTPVMEHDSTEVASISRTRAQDWQALFGDHSDFDEQVRFAASQRVHGSLSDSATQASPASQSVQPTSSVETVVQAPHPSQSAQSTSSGGATTFRPGEGASAASATFTNASPAPPAPTVSPSAYHNPAPSDSQPILVAPEEVARRFRLRAEDTTLLQSAAPERDVSFSIWDYGGQRVFYALHHIFLTSKGLYVVVFDMRELLDVDKLKDKLTPQELAGLATRDESLWFVRFWLNSIKLHAPDASVVLVGTHKDQIDDLEEVDGVLRAAGVVRPDCRLVLPENDLLFFAVDNCSPDVNRAEALRKAVTETATQMDHVHDKVPLAWLKIREDLVESKEPFVPIKEVLAMGATLGQSQTDVRKMLAYFHDVGVVVYLSGSETLERVVVIEPQWLLDKLARVIADDLHARKLWRDRRLRLDGFFEAYERLRTRAIASRSLLAWLWGGEEVDYLIEFMEANMLLCPWKFDVESDEGPFFLVPALLSLTRHIVGTSQFQRGLACELDFSGFYLPDGVFYRLVAQCAVYATQPEVLGPGLPPRPPSLGAKIAKVFFGVNPFLLELIEGDRIRLSVSVSAPRPAFVIKVLVSMFHKQEETMFRGLPWRFLLLAHGTEERVEYKCIQGAMSPGASIRQVWDFDERNDSAIPVEKFASFFQEKIGPLDTDEDGDAVPKVKALPLLGPNVDKHIFLSHKQSTGGDTAGMLKVKLENRGVKVWFDQSYTHTLHHDAMLDGVRRSQMYLLVLTKDVFSSDAVKNELRCAIEAGKQIVLVHESETHRVSFAPFHEYTETVPYFCKDLFTRTESLPIRRKWYEEDTFFSELLRRCNLSVSSGVGKQGFDDPMGESPAVLDFSECDVLSGMCPCL